MLLLVDVFETFRDECIQNYHPDPAHFYKNPGLTWQATLKSANVTLDLFTENDIYLMIERGIRGGVAMIALIDMQKQITLYLTATTQTRRTNI